MERAEILGQLLRGERLASGRLGDLAEQRPVGGGILHLAVVLVNQEPGAVVADLGPPTEGLDADPILARLPDGEVRAARLVALVEELDRFRRGTGALARDLRLVRQAGDRRALG